MFSRTPRWSWLALFAAFNLLFWIAAAVAVGVLASDKVDLGVESFVRAQQATAVAAWGKMASEPAKAPAMPTAAAAAPRPTRTKAPAAQPTARPTQPVKSAQAPTPIPQLRTTAASIPTTQPPTPTPEPTETVLNSPLLVSNPDVNALAQIDAEMARSVSGRPVQIRYDELELNRQVDSLLASYPNLSYQNLHVDLKRDQVILRGSMTVLGFQVNAEVQGTVVARNCLPQAEITKISIAGVVTPGFVKDSIKNVIAESLSWYPPDYPLCLEQIVLEEDRVTVYGSRR
jgi:hypothetical protein